MKSSWKVDIFIIGFKLMDFFFPSSKNNYYHHCNANSSKTHFQFTKAEKSFLKKNIKKSTCDIMMRIAVTFANQIFL